MRRLLLVLPLLLVGAGQWNVDETEHLLCVIEITDAATAAGADPAVVANVDGAACQSHGVSGGLSSAIVGPQRNYTVPGNRRLVLDSYGVVLTGAIGATEECAWQLVADTTTAGAGSLISVMNTGAAAETECVGGAINLDTVGETCTINNFTTVIPGGGWWSLRIVDADGAGANTCTGWQGGTLWVHGRFSSQ